MKSYRCFRRRENEMRAIVAEAPGGPEVLKLEDVPIPEPGPGQARVRVAYASLNPLDTHARAKRIAWNAPTFPFTPGYEYSGLVERVGEGVDVGLVGTRVVSVGEWGGCADYAIATAARLAPIPEGFDWKLGTVFQVGTYSAWHVLHTAGRIRAGDHVLLHSAAGSVAVMAAQIAKEAGCIVYGTCSPEKMDFARPFGFDHLLDSRQADFAAEVKRLTDGRGVDLIVDGVAGPAAVQNYDALAPLGQVIYIGAMAGLPPPVDISRQLYAKTIAVRGFVVYVARAATKGAELPEIHQALRTGRWKVPITGVYPLSETASLHARFEQRQLYGKTLIEVGGEI
jgi:NADPH2:quinone reductase